MESRKRGRRTHLHDDASVFGLLPEEVMLENLLLASSDRLSIATAAPHAQRASSLVDRVGLHNESMPWYPIFDARSLARMRAVSRSWRALIDVAINESQRRLVDFGARLAEPKLVTVPRPMPPGAPACTAFIVSLDHATRALVERPEDVKPGESFIFHEAQTPIGVVKLWVRARAEAPAVRPTRGRPPKPAARRLHETQLELLRRLEPLVRRALYRARLDRLSPAEVKKLLLQHVRSCRKMVKDCETCRKLHKRITANRAAANGV